MPANLLLATLLGLSALAYVLGRRRAFAVARPAGGPKFLHSLPSYYGALTALGCFIPAVVLFAAWMSVDTSIITRMVVADLPAEVRELPADRLELVVNDIHNLVSGNIVSREVDPVMRSAADRFTRLQSISSMCLTVAALVLAALGLLFIRSRIDPELRARNHVEKVITVLMILCSTIAIFTTIGIVLSVLYESIRFFDKVPLTEFLFGLEWSPRWPSGPIRSALPGRSGPFRFLPGP